MSPYTNFILQPNAEITPQRQHTGYALSYGCGFLRFLYCLSQLPCHSPYAYLINHPFPTLPIISSHGSQTLSPYDKLLPKLVISLNLDFVYIQSTNFKIKFLTWSQVHTTSSHFASMLTFNYFNSTSTRLLCFLYNICLELCYSSRLTLALPS